MNGARIWEIAALAVIAFLVALGGHNVLVELIAVKPFGVVLSAAFVLLAVRGVRISYDPGKPEARVNTTKALTYLCAAVLMLWTVLFPARWTFGSCIVAAEVALVFDIITIAAQRRAVQGD